MDFSSSLSFLHLFMFTGIATGLIFGKILFGLSFLRHVFSSRPCPREVWLLPGVGHILLEEVHLSRRVVAFTLEGGSGHKAWMSLDRLTKEGTFVTRTRGMFRG